MTMTPKVAQEYGTESVAFWMTSKSDEIEGSRGPFHTYFTYQAASWTKPRRAIAKVEWHPGELFPRVGFIVTNLSRPAERVVAFYDKRGTCEQ